MGMVHVFCKRFLGDSDLPSETQQLVGQRRLSWVGPPIRADDVLSVPLHHPPLTGRGPRGLPPGFTWDAILAAWPGLPMIIASVCSIGERWLDQPPPRPHCSQMCPSEAEGEKRGLPLNHKERECSQHHLGHRDPFDRTGEGRASGEGNTGPGTPSFPIYSLRALAVGS